MNSAAATQIDEEDLSLGGGGGLTPKAEAEAEESRTEWEIVPVSEAGIDGIEAPKVVEWEELQQELARLWSLSSALRAARERKESLARRLESIIEVKRASLVQTNKMEEMRENLESKKLAVINLSMDNKRALHKAKSKKEHLGYAMTVLSKADKMIMEAHHQLQEENRRLSGEKEWGHLKLLERKLRTRQHQMVTHVSTIYPIKILKEQISREMFDSHSTGDSVPSPFQSLKILGLQLTTLPSEIMSDKKEMQRNASALGYIAHAVSLIASYLNVPLRYPVRLEGSHSHVQDYAPMIDAVSSDWVRNSKKRDLKFHEFPLYFEGQDTTRSAYANFLLNKDLEQLLNYIGVQSLGPRHAMANLKQLIRIILSEEYIGKK